MPTDPTATTPTSTTDDPTSTPLTSTLAIGRDVAAGQLDRATERFRGRFPSDPAEAIEGWAGPVVRHREAVRAYDEAIREAETSGPAGPAGLIALAGRKTARIAREAGTRSTCGDPMREAVERARLHGAAEAWAEIMSIAATE